jgi:hypothetical protein
MNACCTDIPCKSSVRAGGSRPERNRCQVARSSPPGAAPMATSLTLLARERGIPPARCAVRREIPAEAVVAGFAWSIGALRTSPSSARRARWSEARCPSGVTPWVNLSHAAASASASRDARRAVMADVLASTTTLPLSGPRPPARGRPHDTRSPPSPLPRMPRGSPSRRKT